MAAAARLPLAGKAPAEYEEPEVRDRRVFSKALNLELGDTGETRRLFNPQTGQFLPTRSEIEAARREAEAEKAAAEAARSRGGATSRGRG